MKFVKPIKITDSVLTSSNVTENDYPTWVVGTTYAVGDRVISTTTHRIYESVQAANVGHPPETDDGAWWLDVLPTNRWAMFDGVIGTKTVRASPLEVVLKPGAIVNSLVMAGLYASSARVVMRDAPGGTIIYDRTIQLGDSAPVLDWYMYFYEPIVLRTYIIITDLPSYLSGEITATVFNAIGGAYGPGFSADFATASGSTECAVCVIGTLTDLGKTLARPSISIVDYSKKEADAYGNITVVERSFARKIDARWYLDTARVDYVAQSLAAVRATPCVWIVDDKEIIESLIAYGYYKDWGVDVAYAKTSLASITIESLV